MTTEVAAAPLYNSFKCIKGTWRGTLEQTKSNRCPDVECGAEVMPSDEAVAFLEAQNFEAGIYAWPLYMKTPAPEGWEPKPHPGFVQMVEWAKKTGRCFRAMIHLRNSYNKNVHIMVDIAP